MSGTNSAKNTRPLDQNAQEHTRENTAGWFRTAFCSVWGGPHLELIVVQNGRSSENWQWTARGWREPDDCDGADRWGWVETSTRKAAENAALQWYLDKDE